MIPPAVGYNVNFRHEKLQKEKNANQAKTGRDKFTCALSPFFEIKAQKDDSILLRRHHIHYQAWGD